MPPPSAPLPTLTAASSPSTTPCCWPGATNGTRERPHPMCALPRRGSGLLGSPLNPHGGSTSPVIGWHPVALKCTPPSAFLAHDLAKYDGPYTHGGNIRL